MNYTTVAGRVLEPVEAWRCPDDVIVAIDSRGYALMKDGRPVLWVDYLSGLCECPARALGDGCHHTWCPVWAPYESREVRS